jgi:flagellar biosynthesis protein FlhB
MAQRIKEIARENGVPMVENIQLARALAKEVEIGRAVPTKWYQAVAGVLAVVYKIKKAG